MVNAEAGSGAAKTEREETMALVEEVAVMAVAEVAEVKEAKEATATTTIQEEAMGTSIEAEAAKDIMDTITTTHIRGINSTQSCMSNNHQCSQLYHCHTQYQALYQHTKATTWTVMPIKWVATPTVASGATKGSNIGHDQPHLVQRASS